MNNKPHIGGDPQQVLNALALWPPVQTVHALSHADSTQLYSINVSSLFLFLRSCRVSQSFFLAFESQRLECSSQSAWITSAPRLLVLYSR